MASPKKSKSELSIQEQEVLKKALNIFPHIRETYFSIRDNLGGGDNSFTGNSEFKKFLQNIIKIECAELSTTDCEAICAKRVSERIKNIYDSGATNKRIKIDKSIKKLDELSKRKKLDNTGPVYKPELTDLNDSFSENMNTLDLLSDFNDAAWKSICKALKDSAVKYKDLDFRSTQAKNNLQETISGQLHRKRMWAVGILGLLLAILFGVLSNWDKIQPVLLQNSNNLQDDNALNENEDKP